MIVKNEQEVLARCLDSVKGLFDEIIIADTGSTDKTKEIAARYTDKIYDFVWCDDFSKARNFSLEKAKTEYVMWLDADDVIEKEELVKLIALKKELKKDTGTVFVKYNIAFDAAGKPTFSYYRERILKNCPLARFAEPVHEAVIPFGKIIYCDAAISHKKPPETGVQNKSAGRNLNIYRKMIKSKAPLSPRARYYYARELMANGKTKQAVTAFKRFLTEEGAWIENIIEAHICLAECYNKLSLPEKAAEILLDSFKVAAPRAQSCCLLGQYFFNLNRLDAAKFWYASALKCVPDKNFTGFSERDYYEFVPAIWLAVIYDKLGDKATATKFNRLAGSFKPTHPSYLYNEKYFGNANVRG